MINMNKTVVNIIEKAQSRIDSNGIGRAQINGRMRGIWGYVGPLEERYAVSFNESKFHLYHWGTKTLTIDLAAGRLEEFYGESVSDRDSMNTVLEYFNLDGCFRYFPSRYEFIFEIDGQQIALDDNINGGISL